MRRDLKMRRGKEISQACHASMSFLTKDVKVPHPLLGVDMNSFPKDLSEHHWINLLIRLNSEHVEEIKHWLENSFRKICVYVNSEEELDAIHQKALDNGLMSHMIIDNGATEFNGVLTKTCIAIGPHKSSKFEGLTNHLPLL